MPAGSRPSASRKVRKIGLPRAFARPSRPDPAEKAVKIEPNCVVKWKGAILIELQHGFRRFQSTYLAEISRFAMLRPSWPDASGCGHRFFMSFEPPSSKRDQMV